MQCRVHRASASKAQKLKTKMIAALMYGNSSLQFNHEENVE
jgi:hypothetical protein